VWDLWCENCAERGVSPHFGSPLPVIIPPLIHISSIYTFIQLITTVHKSLSDTLSSSSDWTHLTSDHTLLLHYSVVLRPAFCLCPLMTLGTDPTENTVFLCQKFVFIGPLRSNVLLLSAYASRMRLPSHCLATGLCVRITLKGSHFESLEEIQGNVTVATGQWGNYFPQWCQRRHRHRNASVELEGECFQGHQAHWKYIKESDY
jgi:hypothetical protein